MDLETISQSKLTSHHFLLNKENICTTGRFAWKLRKIFAENGKQIDNYIFEKKLSLLEGKNIEEGVSPLSLLPEPWALKDIRKATERILLAIKNGEKITIFGDYDVDGTTSCAMLKHFFSDLNYPVDIYIPDRLLEGYGLNKIGLQKISDNGCKLVITVDNGIAAVDACAHALSLGVDVIITDHHDIPPTLPKAFAILNPKQADCLFPYRMLAGVGVAFYLMVSIRSLMREQGLSCPVNLKNYLDYVALGTIADMAPLTGVNHTLCKVGLEVLTQNLQDGKRNGLYHLLKCAGWNENAKVDSADVGFKIGPRLNAAGRLGNALNSVDILYSNEDQNILEMAQFLHSENAERQTLEKAFTQEALAQVASLKELPEALVLHKEDWHPGVVGLVATRVLDKFYRPVLVFGTLDGKLKGSGRSTHSFDLFSVLNEVRHEFISFGGHFHAVGLTLAPEKLSWLRDYLAKKAGEIILANDKIPPLHVDGILSLECLSSNFLRKLEQFEPYGVENPRTRWLVGPANVKHVKRIGKDISQGHAKVLLLENGQNVWVTAFGMADIFEEFLATGVDIQLVVEAKLGNWNGKTLPEIRVIDYAPVIYSSESTLPFSF
ncbi:single-stranded-DNA-specific exonuclease RecJ [Fluviispira multicolorata]|uniref:Single-stranded-DNA-specific exonuclease RecJ n=1 Tax=Fluviispira multicolorata TaxID=2654512 RepID=A0A833JDS4_9BACT|nr:single-stranded-DNA-specific exonuclease RecJ [Fluviispira multicolorata]KAB8032028.1 single-stranded-DNA-specific exonuclease RecJ [Fluviispira multicolorata]